MRVVVTRPRDQAEATAAALRERGHLPLLEPLLSIATVPGLGVDPGDATTLVITSANAVQALRADLRHLPVACVGEATAAAVRAQGFRQLGDAPGSVGTLAADLGRLLPPGAAVLHLAGEERASGTAEAFHRAGLVYRHLVVYRAVPVAALGSATRSALMAREVDAVLLFSPRTARICCRLIGAAGLAEAAADVIAACLSPAVADAAAGLIWRARRVAVRRDQPALLDCLDDPG